MIKENRNLKIDILKGILIVFVILGHITKIPYFDWFHMPLFFMISGYLLKVPEKGKCGLWIAKRAETLLIPYISYYFVFLLLEYKEISFGDIKSLIVSGKGLVGIFGVWWFPLCLLISSVILVNLINYMTEKQIRWILSVLYFSAIIISNVIKFTDSNLLFLVPWNLDVCLLTVPYMAIGYYYKKNQVAIGEKLFRKSSFFAALFIIGVFIAIDVLGIYQYTFRMKYSQYTNFILAFLIPLAASVVLYKMVEWIVGSRLQGILAEFGKISMVLMYVHNFVIHQIKPFFAGNNIILEYFLLLVICLLSGYIWTKICGFSKISKVLFVNGKVGET